MITRNVVANYFCEICRPKNKEELFNLRHSQLRNVIERAFAILKRRFPILPKQLEYPVTSQAKLIVALTGLQNFLRKQAQEAEQLIDEEIENGLISNTILSCFYKLEYKC